MKKRIASGVLTLSLATLLLGGASASAAVEFGDTCIGNGVAPPEGSGYTLTTLASPGPLPFTAPSAGVITKLKLSISSELPLPFGVPTSIKVLRSAGGANFTTIAETTANATPGVNAVGARIPVQPGDRLGLHGLPLTYEGSPVPSLSFYCEEVPGQLGAAEGNVTTGSVAAFEPATEGRVPLAAILEPDADNDGYGDETQDLCPQSAAVQVACPAVTIDAVSLIRKRSVTVYVTTSGSALVGVTGTVNLGKGKKAKLSAKAKPLFAGRVASFTLRFPGSLKDRLKELEPKRKLTLKLTARATNVAGLVSTDKLRTKLRGQG